MSDQITYDDKADLIVDTTIDDIFKVSASDMNEIKNVVNSHADDIDVANNNITDLNNNKLDINEVLNQASTDTDKPYSADYLNDKLVLVGSTAPQNGERVWFRKSINLFDNTKITGGYMAYTTLSTINTGVRATSTTTGSANYFVTLPLFDVSNYVGKTFTMKCNFTNSGTARGRFIIGLCDKNGGNRIAGKTGNTSGESIFYTIPTLSTSTYLAVWFYVAVGNQVTKGDYVDYTDVQIEEGSTATSYEPYVQPSINVDEEEWYNKLLAIKTKEYPSVTTSSNGYYNLNLKCNEVAIIGFTHDPIASSTRLQLYSNEQGWWFIRCSVNDGVYGERTITNLKIYYI